MKTMKAFNRMDFSLTIITLPGFFPEEPLCIGRLLDGGLQSLNLRKPGCDERQMRKLIERIPSRYRRRLILHGHFKLAKEYGLKGIHLDSSYESIPEGFSGMTVGRSCHTIREASRFGRICDYVFLSPIFDSISKQGYRSAFSLIELSRAFENGSLGDNVHALGGIDDTNIVRVAETGFAGAALLGYIWGRADRPDDAEKVTERFLKINEKWKENTL